MVGGMVTALTLLHILLSYFCQAKRKMHGDSVCVQLHFSKLQPAGQRLTVAKLTTWRYA